MNKKSQYFGRRFKVFIVFIGLMVCLNLVVGLYNNYVICNNRKLLLDVQKDINSSKSEIINIIKTSTTRSVVPNFQTLFESNTLFSLSQSYDSMSDSIKNISKSIISIKSMLENISQMNNSVDYKVRDKNGMIKYITILRSKNKVTKIPYFLNLSWIFKSTLINVI
jgi:hypothetical protein